MYRVWYGESKFSVGHLTTFLFDTIEDAIAWINKHNIKHYEIISMH